MQKNSFIVILLETFILLGVSAGYPSAQAYINCDVVTAVNNFRAANGLPKLQINPILMSIAQAYSDYQAFIRSVTHTGSGGSPVADRAYVAGFGDGESESESSSNPLAANNSHQNTSPYDTITVSTPRDDGAVIHITGYGQSLIGIANSYDVPVNHLLELNSLTLESIIHPGEEIIIHLGNTPTSSPSHTATQPSATPTVTATQATPTPRGTFTPNPTCSPTATTTLTTITTERETLVTGVVVMALVVFLAVVISGFLSGNWMKNKT